MCDGGKRKSKESDVLGCVARRFAKSSPAVDSDSTFSYLNVFLHNIERSSACIAKGCLIALVKQALFFIVVIVIERRAAAIGRFVSSHLYDRCCRSLSLSRDCDAPQ
jgi:hypothetical protein